METASTSDVSGGGPTVIGPTLRIESVPISEDQTTGEFNIIIANVHGCRGIRN